MLPRLTFISLAFATSIVAVPIESAFSEVSDDPAPAIPPKQDPWYSAPSGFENEAPGTILRVRQGPGNLTAVTVNASASYQILFRTTDSHYLPSWAVTTMFVPTSGNASDGGNALLSYQIPYNTADVDASPSYALSLEPFPDVSAALGQGWYVSVPDFEGPNASFTLGVSEGHAVIDSVRAALSIEYGPGPNTRYAMWGYSGGSIASEWAGELQAQYAPELNFSGMAIGGVVPNVTTVFYNIDGGPNAGLIPIALVGFTTQDPEAREYLISKLKTSGPYNETGFFAVQNLSFVAANASFPDQHIFDNYFTESAEEFFNDSSIAEIVNTNGVMTYHGVPQMPMFVYKAVHDEYSNVSETDAAVDRYCGVGTNILYQRNLVGSHLDEYTNGAPRAFQWLKSVLGGTYAQDYNTTGCTIQNVTVNLLQPS